MLVAALSALVLQVAPATYDAKFTCDCRPRSTETSGTLTTRPQSGGDFDVDYPSFGALHLASALRAGRRVIADSPGLQLSDKWQSSVEVLIEDQKLVVPVGASVVSVENGIATVQAHGDLNNTPIALRVGTLVVYVHLDIVEHVKVGRSADEAPALISLVQTVNAHFPRSAYGDPLDASITCQLTAK